MGAKNIISCNVKVESYVKRTELREFQGDLKKENDREIRLLADRIKAKGFNSPIFLWFGDDKYILDGHQRKKALDLLMSEGLMLKDDLVPVVWIEAETIEQAKERLADYNSRYSEFSEGGFKNFFHGIDLSNTKLTGIKIQAVGMMATKPDIPFTEKLEEESNYVVLKFANTTDWKNFLNNFNLPTVKALDSKEGYERKGRGRVIDGGKFLALFEKKDV